MIVTVLDLQGPVKLIELIKKVFVPGINITGLVLLFAAGELQVLFHAFKNAYNNISYSLSNIYKMLSDLVTYI